VSVIAAWHADIVKEQTMALVAERLATAAKFVETAARANLAAISDPDWGAGYRNQVVGRLLTSFVAKEDKAVVAKIGVRSVSGKGGDHHGFYIELGSATAPAHPWLRPALFDNQAEIMQILEGR